MCIDIASGGEMGYTEQRGDNSQADQGQQILMFSVQFDEIVI